MMRPILVLLAVCVPSIVVAQPVPMDRWTPPLATASQQHWADAISWGTSLYPVVIDATSNCVDADQRRRDCTLAAVRVAGSALSVYALKKAFHRSRPCAPSCGSADVSASFPSGHTAMPFTARGGPRFAIAVPMGVLTGDLRILANRHFLTDTLGGAGIGLAWSLVR